MTTLTYDKALELLQRAVDEKGADYVYPRAAGTADGVEGCLNAEPDGTPSCIVGHVLHHLGVLPAVNPNSGSWSALQEAEIDVHDSVGLLLERVQQLQDRGTPWGESIRLAVEATSA